jgi:hypothetical protein
MEADRFDSLTRALLTTPSRRAVATAVVTLMATTALSPLFDRAGAGGKGKGGGKGKSKNKNKNKKKKDKDNIDELPPLPPPPLPPVCQPSCTSDQHCCDGSFCCPTTHGCDYTGGETTHCCAPPRACEGFCCEEGTHCCPWIDPRPSAGNPTPGGAICCFDDEICHPGAGTVPPGCCVSGRFPCRGLDGSWQGCCEAGTSCCQRPEGSYCCPSGSSCQQPPTRPCLSN